MAYTYKYPRPAVTADCIVITKEAEPKVLLIQRGDQPFKGGWAFPGGFMNMDETTEQCAIRELEEETGLKVSKVYQIGAYSKVDRDPRGRTLTGRKKMITKLFQIQEEYLLIQPLRLILHLHLRLHLNR